MTRRRSSPLGLELVLSVVLALVVLPLLSHGAPVQESHGDLQRYSEGCYYNYNHYSEGDRILTNEPCLNCTCHNKMLMCYLRVCPFTKPIGHDCTVEKREDQCCPIVTCPEVPVDIAHHSHQLTTSAPGTELSIPEKYGCSIDNKFYVEGAQVPSNPNKPCELCYCIRNRTACLMQECTLHIDGCQPIYNKGSCCPVRYNCDHENELLEIEDFSTTTTTIRPTEGYLLPSTTSPSVTTDCVHNNEVYADGASITGKSSCEHCYCMRGDIVCAVQECEMPTLESGAKTCRALPPAAGECCPSNYVCDDDSVTTEGALAEDIPTTITPLIQSNLLESVSQEDVQLQEHIDDKIPVTEVPEESDEKQGVQKDEIIPTTISPIAGEVSQPDDQEVKDEEKPLSTTISAIKETSFETTQSPTEQSTTHKTEEGFESSHEDKDDESVHPPKEDEIINEENEDISPIATTVSPVVGDIQKTDSETEEVLPTEIPDSVPEEGTTVHSLGEEGLKTEEEKEKETLPFKEEDIKSESTPIPEEGAEKDDALTDIKKPDTETVTTIAPVDNTEDAAKLPVTETVQFTDAPLENVTPEIAVPLKDHIEPEVILSGETEESDETSTELPSKISKPELETENVVSSTLASVDESDDENKTPATEVTPKYDSAQENADAATTVSSKPLIEPEETSSESGEFSEESAPGQEESQDKIDENISEPSSDTSTSSPVYETITEGDNSQINVPEAGDHKTESDLPKKKPKDEPESIEDIPISSDVTTDEIPQGIIDGITEQIVEVSTSTSTPSSDGADSNELSTTKSSILEDKETLHESTQGNVEDKLVTEDVEIPAVVEEITDASSKPVSGDIPVEDDKPSVTTVLPVKETNDDKSTESQERELSTESSDTETTNRPIRIHTNGDEEESEITTKGTEEEFVDFATSVPSIDDTSAAVTEKEEDKQDSSVSSVIDSEKPSTEGAGIEKEEDATVKTPSVEDESLSSVEEGNAKPEKETDESLTTVSSNISESEHESETNIPPIPHSDESDFTTPILLIDDSGKEHNVEAEQDKIQPEQGIQSTSVPTVSDEAEEQKKQTEQGLSDSTTKYPSVDESEATSTEDNETKTETPALIGSGDTIVGEDNTQHDPELQVTSTGAPSKFKPSDDTINKEEVESELEVGTSDSTTISPNAVDSEISSVEEDTHKTPEHDKETSDDNTPTEILSDSGTTDRSEIEKPSEEGDSDSTVIPPPIPDESESTEEHKTPASDENIGHEPSAQDVSDSSTVVPSVGVSEEEAKQETENILSDLTTVYPSTDEEIKKQPEQELIDSSTITSISSSPEVQMPTTSPSLADSDSQEKDKDIEISEDGSSTGTPSPVDFETLGYVTDASVAGETPSPADSETLGQTTDASIAPVAGEIPSPTTDVPQPMKPEKPIKEAAHDEQPIDETSLAPSSHSDKESVDTTEESYVPMHDIIPSAIPGEGDCLANGKTFANNATVPTSSECEVSCTCISSIIVCKKVQCYEPPQPNDCVPDEASTDKCCPQYICGIDSFAEDQRPTTPEEIEDEEIPFTTFTPSSKYPDPSTESATHKTEHDEPIKDGETSKTELPAFSDENTTPVSMDFEQPALTPEDPLSHVKVDETAESSTKHSDEALATTIQPITAKPTKQVTGDIEQPIEVTSLKPDDTTTPRATDDEDEQKSTTPKLTSAELPSASDSVDKPKVPSVVSGEGFSTESTLEKEVTTLQAIKLDVSTEGPSAPAVIQTDDSTQSEEIPETSDESSNESGEETDSEEETKSPLLHKEDEQTITTSSPLVSEHVGDIEPHDESTSIPEIDYSKPELPEDLSHTKVEDETPTATEKPAKHDEIGELEENEEATEKAITTPASTILTRVEQTEDDVHKVDTPVEISDKKDDIPSSESEEAKPMYSTISPVKSEEEPISETVTESNKDEIEGQTDLPKPISGENTDVGSHQIPSQTVAPIRDEEKPIAGTIIPEVNETSADIIPSTTSPITEDHSIEGSGENVSQEDSGEKQDLATSTISTIDQTLTPVASDESGEEQDKTPIDTIATAVNDLHTSIVDNENAIKNEEIPSQTSVPPNEDQSVEESGVPNSEGTPALEQNEIAEQTSAPAIEEQPSSDSQEQNEIDVTTLPTVADQIVEGSGAPSLGEKSEQDDSMNQTSVPDTDKQHSTSDLEEAVKIDEHTSPVVEGSGAPVSEDKIDVAQDEITSQTTVPTIKEQPSISDLEEQNKFDVTSTPVVEEGSGAPISEDKTDVKLDETVEQTSTPAVEKQPLPLDLEELNKIDANSSPATDEDSVEGSGASVSEDKNGVEKDDIASPTTVPATEKQPSVTHSEEESKITVTTSPDVDEESGSSISEDKTDIEGDELASQTSAPTFDSQPAVSDSEDKNKVEEPVTEESDPINAEDDSTQKEQLGAMDTQTRIPLYEDEVTIAPVSEDEVHLSIPTTAPFLDLESNNVISSQTNAPSVTSEDSEEDKTGVESQTGGPSHDVIDKTVPQTTEKESHDTTLTSEEEEDIISETVAPIVVDKYEETDLPKDQKPTVLVPISEEESEATTVSSNDDGLKVSEGPEESVPSKDASLSGDEYVGATENAATSAPAQTSNEDTSEIEAPSKDTSSVVSSDENIGVTESSAVSTPAKTIEEEKESTQEDNTSSTIIPDKSLDDKIDVLDSTELPSKSTPAKPIENIDEVTVFPQVDSEKVEISEETSSAESEPSTAVTVSTSKLDGEVFTQTETTLVPDSNASGEDSSVQQTEEQSLDEKELTDKTLITTESSLPVSEIVGIDNEENIDQINTKQPELPDEETSTKAKDEIESEVATKMPEIISSHEITHQPGELESDHQILIEDNATVKPLVDDIPIQTESSADVNKPYLEESQTTAKVPAVVDISETNGQPEKSDSVEEDSAEDITKKPNLDESQTTTKVPPVINASESNEQPEKPETDKTESTEDTESKTPQPSVQTESPVVLPSEQDISSEDVDKLATEKPIDNSVSTESLEEDVATEATTGKPAEDVAPNKSKEQDDVKVSSTAAPVDEESITSSPIDVHADSDVTYSTEKPVDKDDTKVQTIEEFVTEHAGDVTTALPSEDKESIPQQPTSQDLPQLPTSSTDKQQEGEETLEASTPSESDESEEKVQVTEVPAETSEEDTKPHVIPTSLPESEENVQVDITTALPSEDKQHIPQQPTSQDLPQPPTSSTDKQQEGGETLEVSTPSESDESEEKVQVTELPAETSEEGTKPHVIPTSLPDSEEKVQVTEVPSEISAGESKPEIHPTSSAEESDEKTDAPEITPEIFKQPGTDAISFSEEKTQAPETQTEVTEEDHKQHIQPTDSAVASSTSDKPIEPSAEDKIDSDLPKPIVQDEQPSSEDEVTLSTTIHPLFPHIELDRTTSIPLNVTDKESSLPYIPTTEQPTSQAITNAPTTHYQPPGYGQVPPQYPSYTEDEYTDEDETEVFGPGTCRYGGKLFVSAQQIPRDDPCDFCFCFRSDIICLQQSCPPPISGCHEEPISGFCCPRYECPVSMATTLNITTSTTTTSTTLPPHFLHHAYRGAAAKNGCHISGKSYKVGDKIDSASGPCMHCTCGGDGQMKCDPKTCSPEPMLRQMIAVVASRRR